MRANPDHAQGFSIELPHITRENEIVGSYQAYAQTADEDAEG